MITRSVQIKDVEIGKKFIHHNLHMYLKVKDIKQIKEKYPDSSTVVNLDTSEVMVLNENYEVDEIVENEEVEYE